MLTQRGHPSAVSMVNDRKVMISVGTNRFDKNWTCIGMRVSELVGRLLPEPERSDETVAEFGALQRPARDHLKDVGGFVGGSLQGKQRKADKVTGRELITLDLDNIPESRLDDVLRVLRESGFAYITYSTRSHRPDKPRLRVIFVTDRTMNPDEYEPVARRLAERLGLLEMCDPASFRIHQLMYWPSLCRDGEYISEYADKPFLAVDDVLRTYKDCLDVEEWPRGPSEHEDVANKARLGLKQTDPRSKPNLVGAFCRVYTIYDAIDKFLSDKYEPTANDTDRYSYVSASTYGGAAVYQEGLFFYSYHATDPVSGRLLNSFDLVRLSRFGSLDNDAKPGTPTNRLPSYLAMCDFALQDNRVVAELDQVRLNEAVSDFKDSDGSLEADYSWMQELKRSDKGQLLRAVVANYEIILSNDPKLEGRVYKDTFAERRMGIAPLPWGIRASEEGDFQWTDEDDDGLYVYVGHLLGGAPNQVMLNKVLSNHFARNSRSIVQEFLVNLEWDEVPRLDSIYIDYLGADDHPYTRAVARKAFMAAVKRAFTGNQKFDYMTVLSGPQGIGKSTLLTKLGKRWFTDSVKTFEGKEAEELIRGKWIVEIGELQAMKRSDVNRIKQFLSKIEDHFRESFGRHAQTYPRRAVFFGSTNDHSYLKDSTGNRRFWPVDCMVRTPRKSVFRDLTDDEVDQIWAEAVVRCKSDEPLILPPELEEEAERRRDLHFESDPREGLIREFVEKPVPRGWLQRDLNARLRYWDGDFGSSKEETLPRDRVCAQEIWCECLRRDLRDMRRQDTHTINGMLDRIPGWTKHPSQHRFGWPGHVTGGYVRV